MVASVTLIVALAMVVVPGSVGSRTPSADRPFDPSLLHQVEAAASSDGTAMTSPTLDPAHRSVGALDTGDTLLEPAAGPKVAGRAAVDAPDSRAGVIVIPTWHYDREISWYGPGFYGNRTACGYELTRELLGVAHRSLPCGTRVTFKNGSRVVTVRVVDRGPYVDDRQWDLTGGACVALGHCYTGPIYWKLP